jgi:hypothetical protein
MIHQGERSSVAQGIILKSASQHTVLTVYYDKVHTRQRVSGEGASACYLGQPWKGTV